MRMEERSNEYNVFMQEVPPVLVQDDTYAHKVNMGERGSFNYKNQQTITKQYKQCNITKQKISSWTERTVWKALVHPG